MLFKCEVYAFLVVITLIIGLNCTNETSPLLQSNPSTITILSEENIPAALSYSTNESFLSDNLTSFVLSEFNSVTQILLSNISNSSENQEIVISCSGDNACDKLPAVCLHCDLNFSCIYGQETTALCRPKTDIVCTGPRQFTRSYECLYCYQTGEEYHTCSKNTTCKVNAFPKQKYQANCTVHDDVLCLGRRKFFKMHTCNWTSGKRWKTAFFLSITLGGLGAERFYLGQWREGLGKLFSFGGLGVWTLVDVILVATGYITPADGSFYI